MLPKMQAPLLTIEQVADLTLPALEKLTETWAHELDPFWIEAKQAVSQKSASGKAIPDYLGIDAIEAELGRQPDDVVDAVRRRMTDLHERCRRWSDGQATDILSRIAVVFDSRPV